MVTLRRVRLRPSGLLQWISGDEHLGNDVTGAGEIAVLLPVKAFSVAKARLAGALDPRTRQTLARWMATRVVAAAHPMPVFVACDDDVVAEWAEGLGAAVLWSPGLGLNGAVDHGVSTMAGKGIDHVVISHGDLPLPAALPEVPRADTIVLVPDRRRDGTNVLTRPTAVDLPASYGAGSFSRHLQHALGSGRRVMVRSDAELSLDLDTVADLHHPMVWPHVRHLVERTVETDGDLGTDTDRETDGDTGTPGDGDSGRDVPGP